MKNNPKQKDDIRLHHHVVYEYIKSNPGVCKGCIAENFNFCVMPVLDDLLEEGAITVSDEGSFTVNYAGFKYSKEAVIKIVDDDYKPMKFKQQTVKTEPSKPWSEMTHKERIMDAELKAKALRKSSHTTIKTDKILLDEQLSKQTGEQMQSPPNDRIELSIKEYNQINELKHRFAEGFGVELTTEQVIKRALWFAMMH